MGPVTCSELNVVSRQMEDLGILGGFPAAAVHNDIIRDLDEGQISGQLGVKKVMSQLRQRFYWPGHWNDVQKWCLLCKTDNICS